MLYYINKLIELNSSFLIQSFEKLSKEMGIEKIVGNLKVFICFSVVFKLITYKKVTCNIFLDPSNIFDIDIYYCIFFLIHKNKTIYLTFT